MVVVPRRYAGCDPPAERTRFAPHGPYVISFSVEVHNQPYPVRYIWLGGDQGKVTENNHRPDFLFPSAEAYRAAPATGSTDLFQSEVHEYSHSD